MIIIFYFVTMSAIIIKPNTIITIKRIFIFIV